MTKSTLETQAAIELVLDEICSGWRDEDIEARRKFVATCLTKRAQNGDLSLHEFRHAARNAVAELMAIEYLQKVNSADRRCR